MIGIKQIKSYDGRDKENNKVAISQRVPIYLSTFKPAVGCTDASDFVVRSFVARLRMGIKVMVYDTNDNSSKFLSFQPRRPTFCCSILHLHPDGKSLTWKIASSRKTKGSNRKNNIPKFDLTTCQEVRHASSSDQLNPNLTGTSTLRKKCNKSNQHKSFSLISRCRGKRKQQFKTIDITSKTSDQCKVLMEGFSALCFRLQIVEQPNHATILPPQSSTIQKEEETKMMKVYKVPTTAATCNATITTVAAAKNSSSSSIQSFVSSSMDDNNDEEDNSASYNGSSSFELSWAC